MAQNTYKYISKVAARESNIFLEEYYSGTDTKIYIDGEEQKEIGYIQYSVNEQLKPIYGYSSMTWDDVAVGSRIVTGVLKMPIKNPNENSSDTIIQAGTGITDTVFNITNMNNESVLNVNKIEWIHGKTNETYNNKVTPTSKYGFTFDETTYQYQVKLKAMGYKIDNLDGLMDNVDYNKALLKFTQDYKLTLSNILTDEIKQVIDTVDAMKNYTATAKYKLAVLSYPGNYNDVVEKNSGIIGYIQEGDTLYWHGDLTVNGEKYSYITSATGLYGYVLQSSLTYNFDKESVLKKK